MKLHLIMLSAMVSFSALANYNDVICSTADQSILFQGDDHSHNYIFTDVNGNKLTYTNREVRMKVTDEWIMISKKVVQTECDTEIGIGLFSVLEDYVIQAEFTKKVNEEKIVATMLCHRSQRIQGKCPPKRAPNH